MLRVLLVDDDLTMLKILEQKVPWADYSCQVMGTAMDGEQALALVHRELPDLVVTDIKMPVMDGLDFCRALQKIRDDIPIILLSAYEDFETARFAMKYNVTDYLLKPLNEQNIQLLCSILRELQRSHDQLEFYTALCTAERQREIRSHLAAGDVEWFCDFFIRFTDCFSVRFQTVREACVRMIELLYALRPDGPKEIAAQTAALMEYPSKMEMVSFVTELYDRVLNVADYAPVKIDYQSSIFQQVYDYIMENFAQPDFSATALSERFHFSADHINRLFSRRTGQTLSVYINEQRIHRALELLHNPDIPIGEVAERSGFRNQNYFTRSFKKATQLTPTEYRLRLQLGQED